MSGRIRISNTEKRVRAHEGKDDTLKYKLLKGNDFSSRFVSANISSTDAKVSLPPFWYIWKRQHIFLDIQVCILSMLNLHCSNHNQCTTNTPFFDGLKFTPVLFLPFLTLSGPRFFPLVMNSTHPFYHILIPNTQYVKFFLLFFLCFPKIWKYF